MNLIKVESIFIFCILLYEECFQANMVTHCSHHCIYKHHKAPSVPKMYKSLIPSPRGEIKGIQQFQLSGSKPAFLVSCFASNQMKIKMIGVL